MPTPVRGSDATAFSTSIERPGNGAAPRSSANRSNGHNVSGPLSGLTGLPGVHSMLTTGPFASAATGPSGLPGVDAMQSNGIVQRHESGQSYRQIAVECGVPESTARAVIGRAAIPAELAAGGMMVGGQHLKQEVHADIVRRHESGESSQQIAVACGVPESIVPDVIRRAAILAERAAWVTTPGGRHVSEDGCADIARRHRDGESNPQIAVALGLSLWTVQNVIDRAAHPAERAA